MKLSSDDRAEAVRGWPSRAHGPAVAAATDGGASSGRVRRQLRALRQRATVRLDILPGTRPTNPFGLTFLRLVGKTADVTINGTRAPGTTFGGSALAFGETWLRK